MYLGSGAYALLNSCRLLFPSGSDEPRDGAGWPRPPNHWLNFRRKISPDRDPICVWLRHKTSEAISTPSGGGGARKWGHEVGVGQIYQPPPLRKNAVGLRPGNSMTPIHVPDQLFFLKISPDVLRPPSCEPGTHPKGHVLLRVYSLEQKQK